MRVGILANSIPPTVRIYRTLQRLPGVELFVVLSAIPNESAKKTILKHAARFLLHAGRRTSLGLLLRNRVVMLKGSLEDPTNVERLKELRLDVGLHKSGVIYRESVINAFRLGILNPHIGILPAYRGRHVMEWSLLQGDPVGVTVFFLDSGIDTGRRIVISEVVDISNCRTIAEAKQQLFDADAEFLRRAVERLQSDENTFSDNDGSGRRYYVMSKLFRGVVQKLIEDGN